MKVCNIRKLAALAALLPALVACAAPDVVVYSRWKHVRNPKTGEVKAEGAFHHASTEAASERIGAYFEAHGLTCLRTDDPAVFASADFPSVKCVVFAVTNHEQFETDAQRAAFYAWARNGGGVVALHSASANERGRKEWREFLGGAFSYHYVKHQSVPFTHVDRAHPAMACLPEGYVWEDDEIYLNNPDLRAVRPLLVLDWKDVLEESRKGDRAGCPPGGGHVLEWCREYGRGRVFYSALGHNAKDFAKPEFLEHILQAARWTMDDRRIVPTIEGVRLEKKGRTVWQLNLANRENKPFVHPLCLPDGTCVTDARPADHPWHLGLWFCPKFINGLNYWEPRDPPASNLFPDGMTVVRDFKVKPRGAACEVELALWYGPRAEPGRVLLEEARTLSFSEPDAKGGYRVRSRHRFTARERVVFDGRRPVSYGGFSCRFAPCVAAFAAKGEGGEPDAARNVAGPRGMTGVSYTCPETGHGVAIRSLKPNAAERLYTWANKGFANPCLMYAEPVVLEAGAALELEYEVVVF